MVKLPDREVIKVIPILHAVAGQEQAAIIPKQHVSTIVRINPHRVVIDMDTAVTAISGKRLAAVFGPIQ